MCNKTVFCLQTAIVKDRLSSVLKQKPGSMCIIEHFGSYYAKSKSSQQVPKGPAYYSVQNY